MESCLRYLERKMRELLPSSLLPFSKWQDHAGIFIIISYAALPSLERVNAPNTKGQTPRKYLVRRLLASTSVALNPPLPEFQCFVRGRSNCANCGMNMIRVVLKRGWFRCATWHSFVAECLIFNSTIEIERERCCLRLEKWLRSWRLEIFNRYIKRGFTCRDWGFLFLSFEICAIIKFMTGVKMERAWNEDVWFVVAVVYTLCSLWKILCFQHRGKGTWIFFQFNIYRICDIHRSSNIFVYI